MRRTVALILTCFVLSSCDEQPIEVEGLPTFALIAHLTFEGDVSDASPEGHDGLLLGGATANGELLLGSNDTDALALPGTMIDDLLSFTISAFVRIDDLHGGTHQLLSAANAVQDDEAGVWYRESSNEWVFGFDGDEHAVVENAAVENGEWHHIAIVRSTSIGVIYLNGLQIGTPQVVSDIPLFVDPLGLVIGQDQDGVATGFDASESWAGAIDNLRVYARPLDASEVADLAAEVR